MEIVTAGLYLEVGDRFLFVCGPPAAGSGLAVLRVGGHREPGETPWQCATREALEETGLAVEPVAVAETLLWRDGFIQYAWDGGAPRPLLVLPRNGDRECNVMYVARAEGAPVPSSEVQGLLLLSRDEVSAVCRRPTTLQAFLDGGGQALLRSPFPPGWQLLPGPQLRLLARLLAEGVFPHAVS